MSETNNDKPVIGITMGDPAGIGPEVVVKALADPAVRRQGRFVIYGMNELLSYAADVAGIDPFWWRLRHRSPRAEYDLVHDVVVLDFDEFSLLGQTVHEPSKSGGEASLAFLNTAIEAAKRPVGAPGHLDAIVTGPICKRSWHMAGERRYPGHTELLKAKMQSKRSVMMFESTKLRVALATVHVALMDIR
ncbi:MAG: 4-hydroxythreonine-4-phosphate dehydrogenase PdxA, partial [Phycisphaeraceae bacterium]|nr:4-hydroxythreonine-4-phosphate dehydrogenase PdxA [Phycisphaeraceae bacterium]